MAKKISKKRGKSKVKKEKQKKVPLTKKETDALKKKAELEEQERLKIEAAEAVLAARILSEENAKRAIHLKETGDLINSYEKVVFAHMKQQQRLHEWETFISCPDTPEVSNLVEVNSCMTEWMLELNRPTLELIFAHSPGILQVINELKQLLELPPENILVDNLEGLGLMYHEFEEKQQEYIDDATYHIIQDLTELYDPEIGVFESIVSSNEKNIIHALWGNLFTTPENDRHEYTSQGFKFRIPDSLVMTRGIYRLLKTAYDHYSDTCKSYYPPGVESFLKKSVEAWVAKKRETSKRQDSLKSPDASNLADEEDNAGGGKKKKKGRKGKGEKGKKKKKKGRKSSEGGTSTEGDFDGMDDEYKKLALELDAEEKKMKAERKKLEAEAGEGEKKKKGKKKGTKKGGKKVSVVSRAPTALDTSATEGDENEYEEEEDGEEEETEQAEKSKKKKREIKEVEEQPQKKETKEERKARRRREEEEEGESEAKTTHGDSTDDDEINGKKDGGPANENEEDVDKKKRQSSVASDMKLVKEKKGKKKKGKNDQSSNDEDEDKKKKKAKGKKKGKSRSKSKGKKRKGRSKSKKGKGKKSRSKSKKKGKKGKSKGGKSKSTSRSKSKGSKGESKGRRKSKSKGKEKAQRGRSKSKSTNKGKGKDKKSKSRSESSKRKGSKAGSKKGGKDGSKEKRSESRKKSKDKGRSKSKGKKGKGGGSKSRSKSNKKGKKRGRSASKSKERAARTAAEMAREMERQEKKPYIPELHRNELNLRKYAVQAGIYNFTILQVPPQPKDRGDWIFRIIEEDRTIKEVPFEIDYEPPIPPDIEEEYKKSPDGLEDAARAEEQQRLNALNLGLPPDINVKDQREAEAEIELKKRKLEEILMEKFEEEKETSLNKLISVYIQVPNTVLWLEPPIPVRWNPGARMWTQQGFHGVKFNDEKMEIAFRTSHFGILALAQNRWTNLPYVSWMFKPLELNKGKFTLTTPKASLEFTIYNDLIALSALNNVPQSKLIQDSILNTYMKPSLLIKTMRSFGMDVFPEFDSYAYVDGILIKQIDLEDHIYQCLSIVAPAYTITSSKWNLSVGREKIVYQMQAKAGQSELLMVYNDARTCYPVNCTETSKNFSEERSGLAEYSADLIQLVNKICSRESEATIKSSSAPFTETLRLLISSIRPLSFC